MHRVGIRVATAALVVATVIAAVLVATADSSDREVADAAQSSSQGDPRPK